MVLQVKIVDGNPIKKGDILVSPFDDYKMGSSTLFTEGIGPCLAIVLYDPTRKLGALAHISGTNPRANEAVFPGYIVRSLVAELGVYQSLEAVVTGESQRKEKISDIVKRSLTFLTIPIIGDDLGDSGTHQGRALSLDCQKGEVTIYRLPPLFQK